DLKSVHYDAVAVRCPADFAPWVLERAQDMARRAYKALGVRDLGRIDFRVADDGQVYFIEINALPSLEPGAGIYAAAALEGLHTDAVLGKVVESAVARWGLKDPRRSGSRPPRRGPLRVGFTYNVKRVKPALDGTRDEEAEYDAPATIQAVREAIAASGHEVIDLEATADLPSLIETTKPDLVFNMAEGIKGRNRESQVPALLEVHIGGREFTVGMLGERRPKVLPPMEVVFLDESETRPVYSFEFKQDSSSKIRYDVPAKLEPGQLKSLERAARECFIALG